jgi:ribosome production factor 1
MDPGLSIYVPKNPHKDTMSLSKEINAIIPNSYILGEDADKSGVNIEIVQDVGPQWIILNGRETQLVFKIIDYNSREYLKITRPISRDSPQLVVNNFKSSIGLKVVEHLSVLFPFDSSSRQIVNFTVEGDFVYFRMYKYCFGEKKPIMEKVGPHLTLRLWRLTEYGNGEKSVMSFKKFIKNRALL